MAEKTKSISIFHLCRLIDLSVMYIFKRLKAYIHRYSFSSRIVKYLFLINNKVYDLFNNLLSGEITSCFIILVHYTSWNINDKTKNWFFLGCIREKRTVVRKIYRQSIGIHSIRIENDSIFYFPLLSQMTRSAMSGIEDNV